MEMNDNSSASFTLQNQTQQHQNNGLKRLSKLLPIAIAIILANGLVFVLLYRKKTLRTASNYLLLGLAMCDFLTGAVNIPFFIMFSFEVLPQQYFFWMYTLHSLVAISAAYHILMITAVKYQATIRPLRHHLVVTKNRVMKTLVAIWITASLIAFIPYAWQESQSRIVWFIAHGVVCLMIVFLVPYVFMFYAYIAMFKVITSRKRPPSVNVLPRNKNPNDRKCIVVFSTMTAIFVCCWLPYFTLMLMASIKEYMKEENSASIYKTFEAFGIIRYVTSLINPLLYTFFKRDFWCALRNLFLKREFSLRPKTTGTCPSKSRHFSSQLSSVHETKLLAIPWNEKGRSNVVHRTQTHSEVPMLYTSSV